jgi:hypothetical protein
MNAAEGIGNILVWVLFPALALMGIAAVRSGSIDTLLRILLAALLGSALVFGGAQTWQRIGDGGAAVIDEGMTQVFGKPKPDTSTRSCGMILQKGCPGYGLSRLDDEADRRTQFMQDNLTWGDPPECDFNSDEYRAWGDANGERARQFVRDHGRLPTEAESQADSAAHPSPCLVAIREWEREQRANAD